MIDEEPNSEIGIGAYQMRPEMLATRPDGKVPKG